MIKIKGLSALEKELCETIWSIDSEQELLDWVTALPRDVLPTAWAMINMILIESVDQDPITDFAQAQEVIDRVKGL